MFGRIRATPSSLETFEDPPSKIIKDDSFSIYETTLMKLKLGAQLDRSTSSTEMDEIINDSSIGSGNMKSDCSSVSVATPSSSGKIITSSPNDGIIAMDTDCSSVTTSPSFSGHVSDGNSEQPRYNNVSILHFFKFKDPKYAGVSSCGVPPSTKNDSCASISSAFIECHSTIEMESSQSFKDSDLSE